MKIQDFFLVGLIFVLLPYFYLSFFTFPVLDDFVFSFHFQEREFFEILKSTYSKWNGRYTSNLFAHLNPVGFRNLFLYKVVSFLIIGLMWFGNHYMIKQILFKSKMKLHLILSLLLTSLFLHNMPIISEGIYWYTGSSIYTLGVALTFLYFGRLIKLLRAGGGWIKQVVLTSLLFLCSGFNEVLTLLIVFFLVFFLALSIKIKLNWTRLLLLQFSFALLFAGILIFSPGNEFRGEAYVNTYDFGRSGIYSVAQVGRFFAKWTFSIPLLAASCLYFGLNKRFANEYALFKEGFYLNKWVSLSLLFVIIFCCVFPPYWATGMLGQHRTLNVAYAFFLPIWFVNLTVWVNFFKDRLNSIYQPLKRPILGGIVLVGLLISGNGLDALGDVFSGSARQYNIEQNHRLNVLSSDRVLSPVKFDRLVQPQCLFISDITDNPNDWKNQTYNLYFRDDSIEIYVQ